MVSTRPPTFKSPSLCNNPLVTAPKAIIIIGANCHLSCSTVFSILLQGRGIYPSFHILSVLFYGQPEQQSRLFCRFSFYYLLIRVFLHQRKLMVFHWRLSDSKSLQVSRTLLKILAVFNNAVVWMVSTRSPTSKSSRPCNNPLVTVPKALIIIGIIVTFMFDSFFNSLARSRYLSLFSHSFSFILWSAGTAKSPILQIFSFFVDYYKIWSSGRD